MNKQTLKKQGFTLVEVLVAILIFSVVVTILFSSFNAFIISSKNAKAEVEQSEKIRQVFKRIRMDFESIFVLQPPRYKKPEFNSDPDPYRFVGKTVIDGQQVISSMIFPSLAHVRFSPDQRGGVARIAYYLKENNNNLYDLCRADRLLPFPEETASCPDPVLCRDVSSFEVVFQDLNGNTHTEWDSESETFQYTFPEQVHLKIYFGAGENRRGTFISIDLKTKREPIE